MLGKCKFLEEDKNPPFTGTVGAKYICGITKSTLQPSTVSSVCKSNCSQCEYYKRNK